MTTHQPDPTDAQPAGPPDIEPPPAGARRPDPDPAGTHLADAGAADPDPAGTHLADAGAADPDEVGTQTADPDVAGTDAVGAVGSGSASSPAPRRSWRRVALLVGIALAVLAIDQITKAIVAATIDLGENIRILGGLVYLTQIRNAGAAFSMATGITWVLAIVALGVVAFIVRMAPKLRSTPWAVCLGLVLGGALGNLSDRLFRAPGFLQGHVVDFISVFAPNAERFPAFNAADSAITVGGIMLVLIALLGYDFDGTRHRSRRSDG